jgi:D-sedoheptulose 7-phosphate isomerase
MKECARVDAGTDSFVKDEIAAAALMTQRMASSPEIRTTTAVMADTIVEALRKGRKVLFAGNGGSAADAQHLAAELVGRFAYDRPGLPAIALTTDTSALTAIGNDYGFEQLFSRQVEALGKSGDVFIGITTSGKSPNILKALEAARKLGVTTMGWTGRVAPEPFLSLSDQVLSIDADTTARVQQGHMIVGHIVCALVERAMFPKT